MFILYIPSMVNQSSSAPASSAGMMSNETDRLSLLAFKKDVIDPNHRLSSWNASFHLCLWRGVTCGRKHHRVTALSLPSGGLVGTLSPHLGNLTFLRLVDVTNNSFHGGIPPELGRLSRLQYFILKNNFLQGHIPANLSNCLQLSGIDLSNNKLEGGIPAQLGSLPRLAFFAVQSNYDLGGSIPPELGNLSSLTVLALGSAGLTGTVPHQLSQLSKLVYFGLFLNQLQGEIPLSILANLSMLDTFGVSGNNLSGTLPANLGTDLPRLSIFTAAENHLLTGRIPQSVCNASQLRVFDVFDNNFYGQIPTDIGKQGRLFRLRLGNNQFGGGEGGGDDLQFIASLVNCTNLSQLDGMFNKFHGRLPHWITNLSAINLRSMGFGGNEIFGSIPDGIGALSNLEILSLNNNLMTGSIPSAIGELANLTVLEMENNRFTGSIPASLGNLTRLVYLTLSGNLFHGSVLPSLANCTSLISLRIANSGLVGSIPSISANSAMLQILDLSNNSLTHPIPSELFTLSSLNVLDLSHNLLAGSMPPGVDRLVSIQWLILSNNQLNGEVPESLGQCSTLEFLDINSNAFEGSIPLSLGKLKSLQAIDLSHNKLKGPIGEIFTNMDYLQHLNLSYNDLEGIIPMEGVFTNLSAISLEGNSMLCGGISQLHFPPCKQHGGRNVKNFKVIIIALFAGAFIIVLILCRIFILRRRSARMAISSTETLQELNMRLVSYGDILKATNNFSSENLIGTGSFSMVYKGVLEPDQLVVVVKVFNLDQIGASKSFLSECMTLQNIRHRNLVKILTCCSGYDYRDKEFKALVYEFMENGTLESWLHPDPEEGSNRFRQNLSIRTRLEIAIDVAQALDYLHSNSHTAIVHCDLKPTNILLNKDMVAHVGDFGLAKILLTTNSDSSSQFTSTGRLKGTIGYIPPEYGTSTCVTTQGDVFSYGVILLEMFIGKKPTNEMFQEGLSITSYAKRAFPEQVMKIVDQQLLPFGLREDKLRIVRDCMVSIIQVGIQCSCEVPNDRMEMGAVVSKLELVRKMLPRFDEL